VVDVHDKEARSRNMRAIRSKNTKPELLIRQRLHAAGFRFRIHRKDLPGNPDIVLPRYRAVIFVHGCFWHGHGCYLFKLPSSRPDFWRDKIAQNQQRDLRNISRLTELGWRVLTIWECALKGRLRLSPDVITDQVAQWLCGENDAAVLSCAGLE
jgi:DNA mismatch endonuclease, patch repair protein